MRFGQKQKWLIITLFLYSALYLKIFLLPDKFEGFSYTESPLTKQCRKKLLHVSLKESMFEPA